MRDGVEAPARDACRRPDDERPDRGGHLGDGGVLHVADLEAGRSDRLERRAVALAAQEEPVQVVQAILPAGQAGLVGSHVLEEPQLGPRGAARDGAPAAPGAGRTRHTAPGWRRRRRSCRPRRAGPRPGPEGRWRADPAPRPSLEARSIGGSGSVNLSDPTVRRSTRGWHPFRHRSRARHPPRRPQHPPARAEPGPFDPGRLAVVGEGEERRPVPWSPPFPVVPGPVRAP